MRIIMPVWSIDDATVNITESAVESLQGHHLTIVDNGSTVGAGKLREWADVYVRNKQNLGYAKAVNQGLRLYLGETVCISNNDIRVPPYWAEVADSVMKADDRIGSVHFRMIPYDQKFSPGDSFWATGKERWCSSSFFVVRAVQLYDEGFLNSYDDWDYWKRFREKGFCQAYTNMAEYQHFDSFTQERRPDRTENDFKNKEYFKQKHGDYAEVLFEKEFPGQLAQPWKPFP